MKKIEWTTTQEAHLRRLWPTGENLKKHLHLFADRSYEAVISHAKNEMKLGPRPKTARGRFPYVWPVLESELKKGRGTSVELCTRTGLSNAAICKNIVDANPGPEGKLHISGWRKRSHGGEPIAIYSIGPGLNAPKPKPLTNTEKARLNRNRKQVQQKRESATPVNPFATAAGLTPLPGFGCGRIYTQSMAIDAREEAA